RSTGTKAAALYRLSVASGESACMRLRLVAADVRRQMPLLEINSNGSTSSSRRLPPFTDFDELFEQRRREAGRFYADLQKDIADPDARNVQRQALASMIWSKQFFYYDVPEWLKGDPTEFPPPAERNWGRNREWTHLNNADILSMPDKWEYPWYAAW